MLKKLLHSLPMGILLALSLCSTVFAAEVNPATGDNSNRPGVHHSGHFPGRGHRLRHHEHSQKQKIGVLLMQPAKRQKARNHFGSGLLLFVNKAFSVTR